MFAVDKRGPCAGGIYTLAPIDYDSRKYNQNLPGMGGVFNAINLHLYHYAGNNPVKYTDPDGKKYDEGPAGQAFRNKVKNENINKPISGGLLSPKQIGNILFNETRSLSGNKVNKAREHVAFTIINADQKYGDKRNKYASTASDKVNSIPEVEKDTLNRLY